VRIIFAGTPALAVPALEEICRSQELCAVLTNPDAPAGRGGRLTPSPVKLAAAALGVPVLQPERLGAEFRDVVRALEPELLVVVAYGRIFGPKFLAVFPRGAINLHPSLLPRHRGPTPIPATILAGDREGGVTIQRVATVVDSGAVLAQERIRLDGTETASGLADSLAALGAGLLAGVARSLEDGTARETEQDHARATFCRKLSRADGLVDWGEDATSIERMVRAYDASPGTYTTCAGKSLSILEASALEALPPSVAPGLGPQPSMAGRGSGPSMDPGRRPSPSMAGGGLGPSMAPGVVLGADKRYGIVVSTGRGYLCVRRLQLAARKAMDWRAFLNGTPGFVGSRLGGSDHAETVDATAAYEQGQGPQAGSPGAKP
jgi:methionyl-tRNA formyltransferase